MHHNDEVSPEESHSVSKPAGSPRKSKSRESRTPKNLGRRQHNASKFGIFATVALLEGESRASYDCLFRDLLKASRPEGRLEIILVEKLTMLLWRLRRLLQAERAEITRTSTLSAGDVVLAQVSERWDWDRSVELSGGMLRNVSNPYLIQRAIEILHDCRDDIAERGFRREENAYSDLKRLYGLFADGSPGSGVFATYFLCWSLVTKPDLNTGNVPPEKLKNMALDALDEEIRKLSLLKKVAEQAVNQNIGYQNFAALVPPKGSQTA